MAGKKRNSSFEILTAMQDLNTPAGALQLAHYQQHSTNGYGQCKNHR